MEGLYGGVETGGTSCVCAVATGPGNIRAREEFATTSPMETIERIAVFFGRHRLPAAIGIGAFGPVDVDPRSPTWGQVTTTPKPGTLCWWPGGRPRLAARGGGPRCGPDHLFLVDAEELRARLGTAGIEAAVFRGTSRRGGVGSCEGNQATLPSEGGERFSGVASGSKGR